MNDRFATQLRHHLLETADARPVDGQLARVIDGVAVTPQRNPLAARLMWRPGLIGPLPTAAIRYGLIAVALALAAVVGASMAGATRQPSSVFEGTWITIDPVDGSGMTLVVGPGQTPAVYFEDGYATGPACVNDTVKRFTARGTGEIQAGTLVATFPDGGSCGLMTVGVAAIFDHDQRRDTLSDQDGVVWTRALGEPPETQALDVPAPNASSEAPTPALTSRPSPGLEAATFVSTMNAISIDYPEGWQTRAATEPWAGGELQFDTPGADVIFDPAYGGRLYLAIASQPYGDLGQDGWRDAGHDRLCPGGGSTGSWTVDGADAFVFACGPDQGAFIFTETRGYMIRLGVPNDEPGLSDRYDFDWLKPVLASVDLRPDDAVPPSITAPAATSEPDSTATPDETVVPEETGAPGSTATPDGTVAPDATLTPDGTVAPEETVAPGAPGQDPD